MRSANIQEVENGFVINFYDNKAQEPFRNHTIWVAATVDEACMIVRDLLMNGAGE